jgi:multiple sugar transport system permease protein
MAAREPLQVESSAQVQVESSAQGSPLREEGLEPAAAAPSRFHIVAAQGERVANAAFIGPAVVVILFFAIFPLIVSLYISFSRMNFVQGGVEINWIGLDNYNKLLFGSQKVHLLGLSTDVPPLGWLLLAVAAGLLGWGLLRYTRSRFFSIGGLLGRAVTALILLGGVWMIAQTTLQAPGRPGTLTVTLIYVFVGIGLQYFLGLGLALLVVQHLPGRRFFRVVFLIPMMITPVGVAYMFRMLTDFGKGPFSPLWKGLGLGNTSWVTDPWTARLAVIIGDVWQWTPFMFIVLLAGLEGLPVEPIEAAVVDGANRFQLLRYITWPAILPVSTTLILIRMIEAFKIVDLPNVLTNGGPGTATESLTLQSFISWRTLDLGGSAAVAYLLLLVVTFLGTAYVNFVRQRAVEALS